MAIRTVTIEVKMDISNAEGKITALTGSLKLLGDEVKRTGKSTDDFERLVTKNMKEGETGIQSLTRRAKELRGEIGSLRNEFGRSPNKSVLGDLEKTKSDLKKIEGFLKNMGNDGGLAGHKFGDDFGKEFILSFRTIPEFLTSPIGGPLVGILAPALIAGVAAAVTSGVGLGIVGAGAFIEHNNPRIQAVFAPLSTDLKNIFTDAAGPLVDPIVGALASIDVWAKREKPALTALFTSVAPSVGLITNGIEGFVSDLVPALTKVGDTFTKALSNPEVQASLKGVSQSFANLFQVIGDNPKEVADGFLFVNAVLKGTFGLLADIFRIVGPVVEALRLLRTVNTNPATGAFDPGLTQGQLAGQQAITPDQFHAAGGKGDVDDGKTHILRVSRASEEAAKAAGNFADNQKQAAEMMAAAAKAAHDAVPDYAALTNQVSKTTATFSTLAGALEARVFNTLMASSQATLGWDQALTNLGQTLKTNHHIVDENSAGLDLNSKKVLTHRAAAEADRSAILAAVQANQQIYTSMINSGISAVDAAGAYDKNTKALESQLHKAGLTKTQIHDLIGQYEKVPDNVNTVLAVKGLTDAINNLDETLRLINHLDGLHANASVTITYHTKGRPNTGPLAQNFSRWGNVYEPAANGLLSGPKIYETANPGRFMIAEPGTGGEAFIPKYGNYARSMSILSAAAGWYGAHVMPGGGRGGNGGGVAVYIYASDPQAKALLSGIRYTVQTNGGDPVKVFTPR